MKKSFWWFNKASHVVLGFAHIIEGISLILTLGFYHPRLVESVLTYYLKIILKRRQSENRYTTKHQ